MDEIQVASRFWGGAQGKLESRDPFRKHRLMELHWFWQRIERSHRQKLSKGK